MSVLTQSILCDKSGVEEEKNRILVILLILANNFLECQEQQKIEKNSHTRKYSLSDLNMINSLVIHSNRTRLTFKRRIAEVLLSTHFTVLRLKSPLAPNHLTEMASSDWRFQRPFSSSGVITDGCIVIASSFLSLLSGAHTNSPPPPSSDSY
jgi:hypothetical protein